jgi:hypothetical protein
MAQAECPPPDDEASGFHGWWRRPERRAHRLLLLLFVELQLADIVSTNSALAIPGLWEANPLMALAQAKLGGVWWLPKAVPVALCCFAAPLLKRSWPLIFAVMYYAMIVSGNFAQLGDIFRFVSWEPFRSAKKTILSSLLMGTEHQGGTHPT